MGIATAVVGLLMLLCVVLAVTAVVRTARAVNRGVERASLQVRRGIDETAIKMKAAQPGAVGQVARLRVELRSSIDTARNELTAGVAGDNSLRESLGLLDRLHEHARVLDRELAALTEREPDRARIAARLPELRTRVAEIKESADSLRHAAQERASQHDEEGLASLREQIDIESGALRHWAPAPGQGGETTDSDGDGRPRMDGAEKSRANLHGDDADMDGSLADGTRRQVGPSAQPGAKWDVSALWQARTQVPGLRRNNRARDVS